MQASPATLSVTFTGCGRNRDEVTVHEDHQRQNARCKSTPKKGKHMYRSRKAPVGKKQTVRFNGEEEITRFVTKNEARLKRSARKYSLCVDDANDVWQQALEIFITKTPGIDESALLAWMHTVVKHEAFAVKRRRLRLLGGTEDELNESELICDRPGPDERMRRSERKARADAALQLLKRAEAKCLILKAQGFSYDEVAEITGFSWTKVNRSISEGRKSFLQIFCSIIEGGHCNIYRRDLEVLSKDNASRPAPAALAHLRGCDTCRASLRELRGLRAYP